MDGHRLDPDRLGDHVDRLYRAAWAMCGSREEAEELVQETFARVLARPRLLRSGDDLAYLVRVLRNTMISRRRANGRRPSTVSMAEVHEPVGVAADARLEEMTEVREVFAAIAALPPDLRDALVAVDVVGLSYAEAGRLLGAKEATITTRLHRARGRVTDRMGLTQESATAPREGVA
ncbi:MAG TPA: RNA polymerase sigma factor [Miltoncostaeaceae bacterium]|nr:RNA polymerase sigma factor [Miltoncostaeaceae bacterium]